MGLLLRRGLATTASFRRRPCHVRRPCKVPWMPEILALRQRVMWPDFPPEYSAVKGDELPSTLHFGVWGTEEVAFPPPLLSVVSVWLSEDGTEAQFRKFCTDERFQRQGLGVSVLTLALDSLGEKDSYMYGRLSNNSPNNTCSPMMVWCNARVSKNDEFALKT